MNLKQIITFLLVISAVIYFTINARKQMEKIENKYETVDNDPLKARVYTLDNGLKVYLTSYKDAPRVQTNIAVRAGSKNDPSDATGLAHYLEHMLFKGTDVYGTLNYENEKILLDKIELLYEEYRSVDMNDKERRNKIWNKIDSISGEAAKYAIANEYDKMVTGLGAKGTNAYTSNEKTVYINDIPSNQIEKWLKLEAERFRNPVFRLFHTELEAVYEEKNISLGNDGNKMFHALMDGLFPVHQYGQQTTIGTVEHLKNPSLTEIRKYFDKYYVPNNMAICLSGDFDFDETIKLIDKYWGGFERKESPSFEAINEQPITSPVVKDVYGPEAERLYLGFRLKGAKSEDSKLLSMVDMILSNTTAGLIDLNLNQTQKIIGGGCFPYILSDYSVHGFYGSPKQGQTLEEVKELLLSQIDEIKSGNFSDWLLDAIVSDFKLNQIKKYETNRGRADEFVEAFILDIPWGKYQNEIKELENITKQQIVDFVNKNYSDNYVVVYKRNGEDKSSLQVTKPKITPVTVNREDQSDFLVNLLSEQSKEIQPVFLDFENDLSNSKIGDVDFTFKKNNENQRFQLKYIFDMGTDNDRRIGLAVDYLKYLGTQELSPAQKQQEFYKLGCTFTVLSSKDKVEVTLSGLADNFEPSVKLFEDILANAVPNDEALIELKKNVLKNRSDAKLNKQIILWRALSNYAKYGSKSSFTNIITESELNSISSKELVELIHGLLSYKHRISYYGPDNLDAISKKLDVLHSSKSNLKPYPNKAKFSENLMDKPIVYIVDYDMPQAEILVLSKGEKLNINKYPIIKLHNEYFGGGMSSIVFQEMRESKALAYSVYSAYRTPSKLEDRHYAMSYIGTQVDKLSEAMKGMNELLDTMPESEANLSNAKQSIIKKIRTERLTKSTVLDEYEKANKMGVNYDIRNDVYNQVENFDMDDLLTFHNSHMNNNARVVMILGSKEKLDLNVLAKYGQIQELTLEDIFGY